jgi:hypothetical protein
MAVMDKSDVLSQATMLADLIEYQAGAVVSRTLVKKRSGTVTLFAFDDGEIVALPADKPHAVKAVSCAKMLLVMLRL